MRRSSEDRTKEIISLREQGMTYEKIGERFGISRQRAYKIIYEYYYNSGVQNIEKRVDGVIYPNIKKWMIENKVPICDFVKMIDKQKNYSVLIRSFLTDKRTRVNCEIIKSILQITGMTFEEAFRLLD